MNKDFNNTNGFGYVDLGLPSGTLWATCNVGADKPSDFGLYFQWGDTKGYTSNQVGEGEGKKAFTWDDYKWKWNNTKINIKYTTTDKALEVEDDAAHVNMGGDWHMPTHTQCQELIDNTTTAWTTQDGIKGMLFTSTKDKSKSIFIPAVGRAWDGSVQGSGSYGHVWSSVLSTSNVGRCQDLSFSSDVVDLFSDYRINGFPVRGVLDKSALKVSDSHKHFELNDKVLVGIAFNGRHTWRRDIYLRYDENKKSHCTFYESSVPDSLIIPYDIDKEGKEVPFKYIMSSLFK